MLKVKQFVFNMFAENTFVVSDSDSREAVVVDPGMFTQDAEPVESPQRPVQTILYQRASSHLFEQGF